MLPVLSFSLNQLSRVFVSFPFLLYLPPLASCDGRVARVPVLSAWRRALSAYHPVPPVCVIFVLTKPFSFVCVSVLVPLHSFWQSQLFILTGAVPFRSDLPIPSRHAGPPSYPPTPSIFCFDPARVRERELQEETTSGKEDTGREMPCQPRHHRP